MRLNVLRAATECAVVVGHSQGGFIGYKVAKRSAEESAEPRLSLIGVASGLKPIWLISLLALREFALAAWIIFVTEVGVAAYIVLTADRLFAPIQELSLANFEQLIMSFALPIGIDRNELVSSGSK